VPSVLFVTGDSAERRASSLFGLSARLTARLASAFALVLAGAFSAAAQDSAVLGTGEPTVVHLVPRDGPGHVADVLLDNRMTGGLGVTSDVVLSIDGLTVGVGIVWGPGTVPDRMTATVPQGFVAIPEVIDVPENTTGTIRIFLLSAMVMG
jgi:hypothetical protein